jgi:hypothetical protein
VIAGPGIAPASDRVRSLHRGSARQEAQGAVTGSGLGLAIVRAIAGRHGAIVELGEGLASLRRTRPAVRALLLVLQTLSPAIRRSRHPRQMATTPRMADPARQAGPLPGTPDARQPRSSTVSILLALAARLGITLSFRALALPDEGRYAGVAWK